MSLNSSSLGGIPLSALEQGKHLNHEVLRRLNAIPSTRWLPYIWHQVPEAIGLCRLAEKHLSQGRNEAFLSIYGIAILSYLNLITNEERQNWLGMLGLSRVVSLDDPALRHADELIQDVLRYLNRYDVYTRRNLYLQVSFAKDLLEEAIANSTHGYDESYLSLYGIAMLSLDKRITNEERHVLISRIGVHHVYNKF